MKDVGQQLGQQLSTVSGALLPHLPHQKGQEHIERVVWAQHPQGLHMWLEGGPRYKSVFCCCVVLGVGVGVRVCHHHSECLSRV